MKLFKNVDIVDLKSIFEKGILSLDESGNNNWENGKRANNSTNVVYLFSPITEMNSFTNYGCALLECEVPQATEIKMIENDRNKGLYKEFITKKVSVYEIKRIYIPKIFKPFIKKDLIENLSISWCGLEATYWDDIPLTTEELNQFAKTAPLVDSTMFNYFRGTKQNREVVDLYNIKYII